MTDGMKSARVSTVSDEATSDTVSRYVLNSIVGEVEVLVVGETELRDRWRLSTEFAVGNSSSVGGITSVVWGRCSFVASSGSIAAAVIAAEEIPDEEGAAEFVETWGKACLDGHRHGSSVGLAWGTAVCDVRLETDWRAATEMTWKMVSVVSTSRPVVDGEVVSKVPVTSFSKFSCGFTDVKALESVKSAIKEKVFAFSRALPQGWCFAFSLIRNVIASANLLSRSSLNKLSFAFHIAL